MRKIKFRAWDKKNQKMRRVYSWNFMNLSIWVGSDNYYVGDFEIMQYTGIHDKNGDEICEGDILKICNEEITVVEWDEQIAGFNATVRWADRGWREQVTDHQDTMEIIGNIYENPELLKNEM